MVYFIKHKILSLNTFLSTYMHTNTHTSTCSCSHERTDYTKLKFTRNAKQAGHRDLRRMKTAAHNRKHDKSTVWGKKMF